MLQDLISAARMFIISLWMLVVCGSPAALAVVSDHYIVEHPEPGSFPVVTSDHVAPLVVSSDDYPGVVRAVRDLQTDLARVTGREPEFSTRLPDKKQCVLIGTVGTSPLIDDLVAKGKLNVAGIAGKWETFLIESVDEPLPGVDRALVIAGSDKRGTIFGVYDLSAQIGVSPWHWWADVPPQKRSQLHVLAGRHSRGEPHVKYRGIFINDEAPALANWAQEKFGGCNHQFYAHVYELILRLRGNYLWPAMWGRSLYDDDPQSPVLADEYGVVIGTSHHEPMMRAHVEWERYGEGAWNYETNQQRLQQFWAEGIRRMGGNESIVTLGMRGDGDEPMTEKANIALLERIVADQRQILQGETGRDVTAIPQVWALYKEVQEYYDRGMRVPDDVTLLLCDDNWGNLRKLPQRDEAPRAGGYGIYYHFDYVGAPRNYKWVNTNPLPRIWEQMHLAWQYGADRIWIVNVGDIKPMEFPTEFFLDYSWSPDAWPVERLGEYTRLWAAQQFGREHAAAIADLLASYLKYNARRKPELLSPQTYSTIHYREAEQIVEEYNQLAHRARQINEILAPEHHDSYFQLVLFPILACANLNELYVTAARNGLYAAQDRAATNALAERVQELFARDADLTRYFHEQVADGKWNHMMSQTHIGYTNWQQPDQNNMPQIHRIDIPDTAALGVAIEGCNAAWPATEEPAVLPDLSPFGVSSRYVEVFNRGLRPFECTIQAGEPWLLVEGEPGGEPQTVSIDAERRLSISVDWSLAPLGEHRVPITISGPDAEVVVETVVKNPEPFDNPLTPAFIEADGYISIEAAHFTRAVDDAPIRWRVLPDLGRTGSAVTPMPVTAESRPPAGDGPRLEYRVRLFTTGAVKVQALVSPTLNYQNTEAGLRYAVSFDDRKPQTVHIHEDRSPQAWERWVADNINVTTTEHYISRPGLHTLKFWMIDPGVVLQKLVIDTGGIKPSYLGPPESRYQAIGTIHE